MENIPSPGFEIVEEPERTDSRQSSDSLSFDDEFSKDEAYLLNDESNLTERDAMTPGMGNIFDDDAISIPSEDSLYHLDENFTLRTIHHFKKRY